MRIILKIKLINEVMASQKYNNNGYWNTLRCTGVSLRCTEGYCIIFQCRRLVYKSVAMKWLK